jgi:outer membrane protein assembly factor BamB
MAYSSGLVLFLDGCGNRRPCKVVGFDLRKRDVRWAQSVPDSDPEVYWFVPRIHIWNDRAVVGSTDGEVVAYNTGDGELAWDVELKGRIRSIGHYETTLYVGTFEGKLYALAPAD